MPSNCPFGGGRGFGIEADAAGAIEAGRAVQPRHRLTQNLLHLHDARIGSNVMNRVGGLWPVNIVVVEDIVEGERLLRSCHGMQRQRTAARNASLNEMDRAEKGEKERGEDEGAPAWF